MRTVFLQISDKMITPIKALKNENNLCLLTMNIDNRFISQHTRHMILINTYCKLIKHLTKNRYIIA